MVRIACLTGCSTEAVAVVDANKLPLAVIRQPPLVVAYANKDYPVADSCPDWEIVVETAVAVTLADRLAPTISRAAAVYFLACAADWRAAVGVTPAQRLRLHPAAVATTLQLADAAWALVPADCWLDSVTETRAVATAASIHAVVSLLRHPLRPAVVTMLLTADVAWALAQVCSPDCAADTQVATFAVRIHAIVSRHPLQPAVVTMLPTADVVWALARDCCPVWAAAMLAVRMRADVKPLQP
jgi:hypothetical protein